MRFCSTPSNGIYQNRGTPKIVVSLLVSLSTPKRDTGYSRNTHAQIDGLIFGPGGRKLFVVPVKSLEIVDLKQPVMHCRGAISEQRLGVYGVSSNSDFGE